MEQGPDGQNRRSSYRRREDLKLKAIFDLSTATAATLDPQQLMQRAVECAVANTAAKACSIRLRERDYLSVGAAAGYPNELLRSHRIRIDERLTALLTGQVWQVDDIASSTQVSPSWKTRALAQGFHAYLGVPLSTGREVLGVFSVYRDAPHAWTQADRDYFTTLANQTALALDNARLYEQARGRAERLAVIKEITAALNSTLNLPEVLELILQQTRRVIPSEYILIALYHGLTETFEILATFPRDDPLQPAPRTRLPASELAPLDEVARTCQARYQAALNRPRSPFERELYGRGLRGYIGVPISTTASCLGVLCVGTREADRYLADHVELLQQLSIHIALAIRNAEVYETMKRAVEHVRVVHERLIGAEKFKALGQMAGGVAHEFNNALGGILGRSQILARQTQDPTILQGLEAINEIGWRAAETVRRLQEFARDRSPAGMVTVTLSEVLAPFLEEARLHLAEEQQATGHSYTLDVSLDDDAYLEAHPEELREALRSMLTNAIEAMPQGGRITIRSERIASSILLRLADTGRGMTREEQLRAFEPFYSTKSLTGVGLGLSVAYGIVSRHRGDIQLNSEPGRGTELALRFPIVEQPLLDLGLPPEMNRPPSVLIVDDELQLAEVLIDVFQQEGYRVTHCASGQEAVGLIKVRDYDLVCTDLNTGDLPGWEVIRVTKGTHPHTPVLLITGFSDQLQPERVRASGVEAVIPKPFNIDEVLSTARRLLEVQRKAGRV
jgi:signal transduction histidine kinase/ActR/RegA family two-component response regulator